MDARAIVIHGDNIDTDVLYPGQFLSIVDTQAMTAHLFEGLDPSLRDRLGGDTALVVGDNFGAGSSREHVPQAMRASGIRFLVGRSFARIFHRNCVNLGLPVVIAPEAAAAARDGSRIELHLAEGIVRVDGAPYPFAPLPAFMHDILATGGLVPWVRARLDATTEVG